LKKLASATGASREIRQQANIRFSENNNQAPQILLFLNAIRPALRRGFGKGDNIFIQFLVECAAAPSIATKLYDKYCAWSKRRCQQSNPQKLDKNYHAK